MQLAMYYHSNTESSLENLEHQEYFCLQCCFFKRKKPVKQLKLTFSFRMSLTCCDLGDTRNTPKSPQLFMDFLSLIKKKNNNTSRYFYGQGYFLGKHKHFQTLVWSIFKSCTDLTVYTLFERYYTFLPGGSFFNF